VRGREGAFLIVEPAGYIKSPSLVGASIVGGQVTTGALDIAVPMQQHVSTLISAATFRVGSKLCSLGTGSPIHAACPAHRAYEPQRWFTPTRSLHAPVGLTLLLQSPGACKAAFLLDPCYKGEVEFSAPYAVTTAATDYVIQSHAECKIGGRPESGWALERDVKRHQLVRTVSLGLFVLAPSCAAHESFEVAFQNLHGPSPADPHESVVIGTVFMSDARYPSGARVTGLQ
jgi:hypothetical protein